MAYTQDLSQAQNGAVTGRGGNVQQLGPSALRRLQSMGVVGTGTGGQTPGSVPPIGPTPTMPPPPEGWGDVSTPGGMQALGGWGGGPQSLGGQSVQDPISIGQAQQYSGGGGDQLQTHMVSDYLNATGAGSASGSSGGGNTFPMPQSMMPQEPFQIPGQQPPTPGSPNIQAAIQGIRAQLGAPKPGATGGAGTPWQSPPITRVGGPNTQFPTKPQQKPGQPQSITGGGIQAGGVPSAGGAQPPIAPKPMTGGVAPYPITDILKQRMMQNPGMAGRQSQHV